jgi:hypothetical protein
MRTLKDESIPSPPPKSLTVPVTFSQSHSLLLFPVILLLRFKGLSTNAD